MAQFVPEPGEAERVDARLVTGSVRDVNADDSREGRVGERPDDPVGRRRQLEPADRVDERPQLAVDGRRVSPDGGEQSADEAARHLRVCPAGREPDRVVPDHRPSQGHRALDARADVRGGEFDPPGVGRGGVIDQHLETSLAGCDQEWLRGPGEPPGRAMRSERQGDRLVGEEVAPVGLDRQGPVGEGEPDPPELIGAAVVLPPPVAVGAE